MQNLNAYLDLCLFVMLECADVATGGKGATPALRPSPTPTPVLGPTGVLTCAHKCGYTGTFGDVLAHVRAPCLVHVGAAFVADLSPQGVCTVSTRARTQICSKAPAKAAGDLARGTGSVGDCVGEGTHVTRQRSMYTCQRSMHMAQGQ